MSRKNNLISQMRSYSWKPYAPLVLVLVGATLFLPTTGSPPLSSLEWYQQAVSLSVLPSMLLSAYLFWKETDYREPEERVLDDE